MATGDGSLEWVEIADFTPGIHAGIRSIRTGEPEPAADGVAQITDTWGCVGNPNGGLEPAPKLVYEHEDSLVYAYDEDHTEIPEAPTGARILDMVVAQSTLHQDYTVDAEDELENPPDAVMLLAQQQYLDEGDSYYRVGFAARWYPLNDLTQNLSYADFLATDDVAAFKQWGHGHLVWVRSAMDEVGAYDLEFAPHANVVIQFMYREPTGAQARYISTGAVFPNSVNTMGLPPAGYTDLPGDVAVSIPGPGQQWQPYAIYPRTPVRMVYHQGRLLWSTPTNRTGFLDPYRDSIRPAADGEDLYSDEQLQYRPIFNPTFGDVKSVVVVDSGRPDMIGAMLSVNTTELYIVKARGGGVIVRDSLERPSVNRYPGVESTGAYPHTPVLVPGLGLVYGGSGGVFSWAGGNQSKQLSASIDGAFWLTPENEERPYDDTPGTPRPRQPVSGTGRFAYLFPYIYAPNNWIMDVRTGGWFRLYPTREINENSGHDLAYFDVSGTGRVYAAPDIQPADSNVAWVRFNPNRGTNYYSWRSQPLSRPLKGRQLEFREVQMVLSGSGVVTVTLIALDGTETARNFSINSPRPQLVRRMYHTHAYDVEVRITSTANDAADPAPTVHRMSLGYKHAAASNSTASTEV